MPRQLGREYPELDDPQVFEHMVAMTVAQMAPTPRTPPQRVEASGELAAKCEALSFNPWHTLAEHRPIGGMNRLRRAVYQTSVNKRTSQREA